MTLKLLEFQVCSNKMFHVHAIDKLLLQFQKLNKILFFHKVWFVFSDLF